MDYTELRDAVQARLDVVADHGLRDRDAAQHLEKLIAAAQQLDALVANLPRDCDPQLRHYLEKQSYLKAVDWFKTQQI